MKDRWNHLKLPRTEVMLYNPFAILIVYPLGIFSFGSPANTNMEIGKQTELYGEKLFTWSILKISRDKQMLV